MSSRIEHGVLTPVIPCNDPECTLCGMRRSTTFREGPPRKFLAIPVRDDLQWEGWFDAKEITDEQPDGK